jgi:hypothetical protein
MSSPDIDHLRKVLWPTGRDEAGKWVYALVDTARDPSIYPLIRSENLMTYACLYAGSLPWELARVAPYLVLLDHDSEFTDSLLELGWGNHWAVCLTSTALPDELRGHFRRFLQVRDEGGRKYLFRFYDPRVLRTYLPTCTEDELRFVFGPVDRYIVEGEQSATAIEFRRAGNRLSRVRWREGRPIPSVAHSDRPRSDQGARRIRAAQTQEALD